MGNDKEKLDFEKTKTYKIMKSIILTILITVFCFLFLRGLLNEVFYYNEELAMSLSSFIGIVFTMLYCTFTILETKK